MRCKFIECISRCSAIACLLAVFAANLLAAEVDPYEARVIVVRAQVRSGPGDNFYPTSTIGQGETVEVYRELASGWLAIRPPQDSFSWVFGRHLKLRADGYAEVDKTDVDSRIGSRFGNQRNAVQVRLRKGEAVEILGEEQSGGETWYKIAAPAGEFRWIQAAHVERIGLLAADEAAPESDPVTDPDDKPIVVAASATDERKPDANSSTGRAGTETSATEEPAELPGDDWRAAPTGVARTSQTVVPPPLTSSTTEPANIAVTPSDPAPADVTPVVGDAAPASGSDAQPDSVARDLTDIELRLSRMVAAPPDRWNTARLERDTEALLAQAQTSADRDAAKAMLAKLDRFDSIGRRHQQTEAAAGSGLPGMDQTAAEGVQQTAEGSKFDAVGILRPVVSKRPGAPQFALVDDRGQVISFVTPTPDVNLQPYLGHRVGVVGTRGFISEFQRAHVTAGRVMPLGDRLVR